MVNYELEGPNTIRLDAVPLSALRPKSHNLLALLLNPIKHLPSEDGLPRDWRGVSHLAGLESQYGPLLSGHQNPTSKVIEIWSREKRHDEKEATLAEFQQILGTIDRWDVIDDTQQAFMEDAHKYLTDRTSRLVQLPISNEISNNFSQPDANLLTIDDNARAKKGLPPQQYDAFILFADEDIDFATELIEKMEQYGIKLCVKERDLIGGIPFEHEAILRLISERCNRLIVIVSPAFLKSSANTFFVNFAQALGIEQGRRKIVPCLYEKCVLPPTLSFYFLLNYQRSGKLWNFWEKLRESIQNTPAEIAQNAITYERATIQEIPTTPAIEMPPSPASVKEITFDLPPKTPRRKKPSAPKTPEELTIPEIVVTSETDGVEKRKIIMPPAPRLRASSMLNLSEQGVSFEEGAADLSKSTFDLSRMGSPLPDDRDKKKRKWYKKLLSPSPSKSGSSASESDVLPDKTKKKWFRKKLVPG